MRATARASCFLLTSVLALFFFLLITPSGDVSAVEPKDARELLERSLKEMQRQDSLLAGCRYMKTVVVEQLDEDLKPGKSEVRLVEVTSVPRAPDTEILIAVDGKPISQKEKEKEETRQKQRKSGKSARFQVAAEDLLTMFDWSFAGNETLNGRPCTALSFKPKPGAAYTGKDPGAEKFMRCLCGTVFIDNAEYAVARIEFRSTSPVKSLGGLLWTVHSFAVSEERKRLPPGFWIDAKGEYFVEATAVIFKKIRQRLTMHTHDYAPCCFAPGEQKDTRPSE
ncbi:MAG: hypothetical protein V2A71_02990 [Candidatus Eisenbacteria bacterium]